MKYVFIFLTPMVVLTSLGGVGDYFFSPSQNEGALLILGGIAGFCSGIGLVAIEAQKDGIDIQ